MVPKSFWFVLSLKNGAAIMAASNMIFALTAIIGASVELFRVEKQEYELYLIVAVVMGFFNLFIAGIITIALIAGNERYVLLYILLEFSNLFIITIFAGINIFEYRSLYLGILFVVCLFLWYGLYCMYGFYAELAEYNSVKSGVIEITCNTNINPIAFPEKAVESTAV
ncbi:uncharacterized protein [Leptinotarsa decemlineata]|uniref:uncharacterized protein n=1 Tax=Leptinotarsa decemlineata TaxID=7539 RepID=UPI000C253A7B|nr:uncharacterized protein LOC111503228 [Leptinotarsa decemlineata]